MKTYRSTQLFLYCSGGERSVKCVRPALGGLPGELGELGEDLVT